ncbi:succinate dehydrogenase assembly factor 4, mitochondrial-like [Pollicipes pollicipes]|uniref:succinate dehydrogenase assembly factor 4, mitochondrial-like n=1 Tax=Pollicipes pollicipes TaxID=41117 RepID=UPI001884E3E9|nr:succinate dehydrogenase assembly factor 4, mitochondrial-like [Pollicipes pollicipes]
MFPLLLRSLQAHQYAAKLFVNGAICRNAKCPLYLSASLRHEVEKGDRTCNKSETNNPIKAKTPIGKLDELDEGRHPFQEKEPLAAFPDGVNPRTGEVGGPRGPEPTRYGDWERKGRVTDF